MGRKWKGSDIKKLIKKGAKVKGMEGYVKPKPPEWEHIKSILEKNNIEFETEKLVDESREFKHDFFVPKLNLAIEYEGLGRGGDKSKMGGHQTPTGFTSNCTKYNMSAVNGYTLLRYTTINHKDFESDLKKLIKKFV